MEMYRGKPSKKNRGLIEVEPEGGRGRETAREAELVKEITAKEGAHQSKIYGTAIWCV